MLALRIFAAAAVVLHAGTSAAGTCTSSNTCAPPTPYCHPSERTCVACLDSRNCPTGAVCEPAKGECRQCVSEADCPAKKPRCDSRGVCVECLTDGQCGNQGIQCEQGVCGHCGDGICAPTEGVYFPNTSPPSERLVCTEDCGRYCPTLDLGSSMGSFTVDGSIVRNIAVNDCNTGIDGADAIFAWRAPHDGEFTFKGNGLAISAFYGDCHSLDSDSHCVGRTPNDAGKVAPATYVNASRGDSIVIMVEMGATSVPSVTLVITCDPPYCSDSTVDAGRESGTVEGGSDPSAAACLMEATRGGGPHCVGAACACEHCSQGYDACASVPGCTDIVDCMLGNGCVAMQCDTADTCTAVIDALGGTAAPAFDAATRLQSCALTFACTLPCGTDGGAKDAGDASPDAIGDAAPRMRAAPEQPVSGCDCSVVRGETGRSRAPGLALVAVLALGAAVRRITGKHSARRSKVQRFFQATCRRFPGTFFRSPTLPRELIVDRTT